MVNDSSSASPAITIGYKASAEQFGPQALCDVAVLAENLGFDSVWVSDHLQPWQDDAGHSLNALVWLANLAARTDTITLGTSVLTPTFRYHPAVVAQSFATLGCLHPGRIIAGLGTGEPLNEQCLRREPWPPFSQRLARLDEAITMMSMLWGGQRCEFHGDYYHLDGVRLYDVPQQPIPIYLAAGGPKMARYVGEHAHGFICTSGKDPDLYSQQLLPALREGVAAAGKPEAAVTKVIEIKLSYDRDATAALHNTRWWAPIALSHEDKQRLTTPAQFQEAAAVLPIEQVASRWIVASTPQQAVSGLQPYLDMGFTHLVLHGPGLDQERFLRHVAADVLPAIRQAAP